MYRDQLHCVLAPPADHDVVAMVRDVARARQALEGVLVEVGEVHYASLFVLPPRPADARPTRCVRLGLELTVDEAVSIDGVLTRLVAGGLDALWPLYAVHSGLPDDTPPAERKRWLAAFLIRWVRRADGGFVGARDTTVRQVHEETRLYAALRREGEVLSPLGLEREDLAERLSGVPDFATPATTPPATCHHALNLQRRMAVARAGEFPWADATAPENRWCAEGLGVRRRIARIAVFSLYGAWIPVIVVVAGTSLAAFGALAAAAAWFVAPAGAVRDVLLAGHASSDAVPLALPILWTGTALAAGLVFWVRVKGSEIGLLFATAISALLLFIAITLLVVVQLATGALTGGPLYTGPLASLQDVLPVALTLALWGTGWLLATAALGATLAIAGAAAIAFAPPDRGTRALAGTALLVLFVEWALVHLALHVAVPTFRAFGVLNLDLVYGLSVLIVIAALLVVSRAARLFDRLARPIAHRRAIARLAVPVPRAHQVHPSVVACEADLVNRCNHLISLTELRSPVAGRWLTTWLALRLVGRLADTWWYRGELGNASGIHFAHWYLIDEGRRLLFLSNYDGVFSGYLDEFILGAAEGTNLVWRGSHLLPRRAAAPDHPAVRHPRMFPTVVGFVLRGCAHEQWFKAYVRDSMLPHVFRFSAYDRSLQNILAARRVRNARCGKRGPVKDDALLRALER